MADTIVARWVAPARIDHGNAMRLISEAKAALRAGGVADLSQVEGCDSSAVALLLALKRLALPTGAAIELVGMPRCVAALTELYELEAMLS